MKVAMKVPSTNWLAVSRMKLRTRHGPNCVDASDSDAIVIENVSDATVIMEPAIVASSQRATSALPALLNGPLPRPFHSNSSSSDNVKNESATAPADIKAGRNQNDSLTPR